MSKKSTKIQRIQALESKVEELQNMVNQLLGKKTENVKILKMEPIEVWTSQLRATELEFSKAG